MFRIPSSKVFSDQAVHSFQPKLLRKEKSCTNQFPRYFDEKLKKDRNIIKKDVEMELLTSMV